MSRTEEDRALDFIREMPRPHRLVIFAGAAWQAQDWARRHGVGPSQFILADSAERLRGLSGPFRLASSSLRLVRVGTWMERRDCPGVIEQLLAAGLIDKYGRTEPEA